MYKSNAKSPVNTLCERCGQKQADAVCFTCNTIFCFQCCIQHSQANTSHVLKDLPQSIQTIGKQAKDLIYELEHKQREERNKQKDTEDTTSKLHPQNFQRYLDEIDFIKKEVFKFVDRFFSELSLQFVNMWEAYLLKFTTGAVLVERIEQLIKWIKPYTTMEATKSPTIEMAKMYISENFDDKVSELMQKSVQQDLQSVPECPRVVINERILAEVEETLCKSIFTVNYKLNQPNNRDEKSVDSLRINMPDSLESSRKIVPVFPMRGKYCFLFNLETKDYDIQQFEKLDILPAYPKSILLPSGDLHLIGGVDDSNNLLQQHIVYRHHKGEIAKLAQLPSPKNPSNGLVYLNNAIYVIGGLKAKGGWDSECLQYDVKRNEWKVIPSMNNAKPHQSVVAFRNSIIAFGLSFSETTLNIERLDVDKLQWKAVSVSNLLSNPFNFAAGFSSIQVNEDEILLFGGKSYEDSLKSNKRTTDKSICPQMFLFNPDTCSFSQLEKVGLATGTQFGEINPIIIGNAIYSFEFLISRTNPIVRWYDNIQVVRMASGKQVECLIVMQES